MNKKSSVPKYSVLINATFKALKELGGSGKNQEINDKAVEILHLSDEVQSIPHLESSSLSEVNYRLAWARTLLKNYGAIENSARSVWSIRPEFSKHDIVDGEFIEKIIIDLLLLQLIKKNLSNNKWKTQELKFLMKLSRGERSCIMFL